MKTPLIVTILLGCAISYSACKKDKGSEPDAEFTGTWIIDSIRLNEVSHKGIVVQDSTMYYPKQNFTYDFYPSLTYKIITPVVTDTGLYSRSEDQIVMIQQITGDTFLFNYRITGKQMKLIYKETTDESLINNTFYARKKN